MPGAERDPQTGLPPRSAGPLHDISAEKPLHPRNVERATVLCQAAFRRWVAGGCQHARRLTPGVAGGRRQIAPPVAAALFFCRHLRRPNFINIGDEANCICALICGREPGKTLKLGDLSDAYEEYSPHLAADHPALMMVLERFDDVVVDVEEDATQRMQNCNLPSEAESKLRETMLYWRSPEERPRTAVVLYTLAKETIDKLRQEHEQVLIHRLVIVNNQEAYAAMMAEVEREFVGARTILRAQLRAGRNRHRALTETELSTMYGWPPRGPGPSLKRAARLYLRELGHDHPLVEDFVAAARRHVKEKEDRCIEELSPGEKEILRLRSLIQADPAPPKLMLDDYKEKSNEWCMEAMKRLEYWLQELGADGSAYLRFLKSTLGEKAFPDDCEAKAQELANELRSYGPRPPPSLEDNDTTEARAIGATSLAYLLESLETNGRQLQANALRAEFLSELKRVEEAVAIFKDKEEDVGEGWHKPPGFEIVDAPVKVEVPPPPPPKKEIKLERQLPGMKDAESLSMLLHGVSHEDVDRHSEILLLEMCADIIAEECNIPRDCISNMAFSAKKVAKELPEELPEDDDSKDLEEEVPPEEGFGPEAYKNPLLKGKHEALTQLLDKKR